MATDIEHFKSVAQQCTVLLCFVTCMRSIQHDITNLFSYNFSVNKTFNKSSEITINKNFPKCKRNPICNGSPSFEMH